MPAATRTRCAVNCPPLRRLHLCIQTTSGQPHRSQWDREYYDEALIEPYAIRKTDHNGRLLGREFNRSRKTDFATHVWQEGTSQYFSHFGDLRCSVSSILERSLHRSGAATPGS